MLKMCKLIFLIIMYFMKVKFNIRVINLLINLKEIKVKEE